MKRRAPMLLAVIAALVPDAAHAVAPRADWQTIVTPNFRVHFHEGEGEQALAEHVAASAEEALEQLSALMAHRPDTPIHIALTDETDSANGFAEVLPRNLITLFAAVPEPFSTLGDYDDYLRLLVIHELFHVVHIDTIGGIPALVNQVLGKTMAPNSVQPQWFIEGAAVWAESKLTGGGRLRSSLIDLFVREMVLSDRLPTIDVLSHFTRRFPGGGLNWFVGGRFIDFIARRHGADAIASISLAYGSRLVPYGLNFVAEEVTGETMIEMFDAWVLEERARALDTVAPIRAAGVIEGTPIERESGLVLYPRFSKTGRLAIVEQPQDGDSQLVILDGERELYRARSNDGRGDFTPDGERFVATVIDTSQLAYSYSDLEIIDVATGRRTRRTHGARLSEPRVSPDGRTIVALGQQGGQTHLVTLPVDGASPPVRLPGPAPGVQLAGPMFLPDSRTIVVSALGPRATRHLWLWDPETGPVRALTAGDVRDVDPVLSADGASVYFSRDAGGLYDLHRLELASGAIERLTRVESGAFQPAPEPDGRNLVYVIGTPTGWALRRLALDPGAISLPLAASVARPEPVIVGAPRSFPIEPYAAFESLLPRNYLPTTGLDGVGDTIGVLIQGTDALRQHNYSFRTEYGLATERFGFDFDYVNRQTPFPISAGASLHTTRRPGSFLPALEPEEDELVSSFRARTTVSFPLGRWDASQILSVGYAFELRRGTELVSHDPLGEPPGQNDLNLSSLSLTWSFSEVRGFAESYGPGAGIAADVLFRLEEPTLGSDLRLLQVVAHASGFFTLPWLEHHVLAGRISLGGAAGQIGRLQVFALGGLPVRDVLKDAVDRFGSWGTDVIRGYEIAAIRGNAYYLGSLEYRFPIVAVSQGLYTLPVFVDRLYAAAFVDAGAAFRDVVEQTPPRVGIGAELRLDLVFGYYQGYTLRFGYGRGLSEAGIDNVFLLLGGVY